MDQPSYEFLDELTKNKAAGSQREANLMKKCKCYNIFTGFKCTSSLAPVHNLFLVNNDNIVRLIDVFECDGKLHLIMEYCQGGDLRALIRKKLHEEEYFSYSQVRTRANSRTVRRPDPGHLITA